MKQRMSKQECKDLIDHLPDESVDIITSMTALVIAADVMTTFLKKHGLNKEFDAEMEKKLPGLLK
jgi:hypothetical protein